MAMKNVFSSLTLYRAIYIMICEQWRISSEGEACHKNNVQESLMVHVTSFFFFGIKLKKVRIVSPKDFGPWKSYMDFNVKDVYSQENHVVEYLEA